MGIMICSSSWNRIDRGAFIQLFKTNYYCLLRLTLTSISMRPLITTLSTVGKYDDTSAWAHSFAAMWKGSERCNLCYWPPTHKAQHTVEKVNVHLETEPLCWFWSLWALRHKWGELYISVSRCGQQRGGSVSLVLCLRTCGCAFMLQKMSLRIWWKVDQIQTRARIIFWFLPVPQLWIPSAEPPRLSMCGSVTVRDPRNWLTPLVSLA